MDEELERRLRAKLTLPVGIDAARDFLHTYVQGADPHQIEGSVRYMMRTNPVTVLTGIEGLTKILASDQPPGTLAELVELDANKSLDEYTDDAGREWLSRLLQSVRQWADSEQALIDAGLPSRK